MRSTIPLLLVFLVAVANSWSQEPVKKPLTLRMSELANPAGERAAQVSITTGPRGRAWMSWVERQKKGHRLRFSVLTDDAWSKPRTVASGSDWFVNWADFPSLAVGADGRVAAHWLQELGTGTFDYGVRVSCSVDGGETFGAPFWVHDDESPAEHGFATLLADANGFTAVWLDGRTMRGGGTMQLRTRTFDATGKRSPEVVLDEAVCECCCTTAGRSPSGDLIVLYRDRTPPVRDIAVVRRGPDGKIGWTPLSVDGWKVPG